MITELVLIVSLASSTMIKGTDAQPMHEMSDEDFELFVESNADMLETVGTFVLENKHTIAAGAITGLIGRTFSGARGAAALMAAGSVAGDEALRAARAQRATRHKRADLSPDLRSGRRSRARGRVGVRQYGRLAR